MKALIVYFFLFSFSSVFGQDTLREQNSVMYGRYYVLFENQNFVFHFNHCTGQTLGFGKYKIIRSKIFFEFDSIPEPETQIIQTNNDQTDSIQIELFDITDSSRIEYFVVKTETKFWTTFDGVRRISTNAINQDSLQLKCFGTIISVPLVNEFNVYKVYIFPIGKSYTYDGIKKMKKRKDVYFYKIKVRDSNEEKPWKKGKVRKIYYQYKIE